MVGYFKFRISKPHRLLLMTSPIPNLLQPNYIKPFELQNSYLVLTNLLRLCISLGLVFNAKMFLLNHLKNFERAFKVTYSWSAFPLQWDSKQEKVYISENFQALKRKAKLGIYLHIIQISIILYQARVPLPNSKLEDRFLAFVILLGNACAHHYLQFGIRNTKEIALCINAVLGAVRNVTTWKGNQVMIRETRIQKLNLWMVTAVHWFVVYCELFVSPLSLLFALGDGLQGDTGGLLVGAGVRQLFLQQHRFSTRFYFGSCD